MPQLQEQEIRKIIKQVESGNIPDWKKTYCKRLCENLQVHTKGLIFSKVNTLFPNEHPDSKDHCVGTYEPITKGSVWKGINDIIRIFSNSGFSFSASTETIQFVQDNNFEDDNLFNWFIEKWNEWAVATDSNAWCAVYPPEYTELRGGDLIRFVKNEHLCFESDDMVAFVSEEESQTESTLVDSEVNTEIFPDKSIGRMNSRSIVNKTYNQKISVTVKVKTYHVFRKDAFIRLYKENASDQSYTYEIFYFSENDMIHAFPVGGSELYPGINESFVAPFIPFGNKCILAHRNHNAVDLMFSYPRMSEVETPCDAGCAENDEKVFMLGNHVCHKCNGSGYITVQSPYKVYRKRLEVGLNDPDVIRTALGTPPVEFYTPDVGILTYSKDNWKDYLRMAEEAIFVVTKKFSGDAESADAKRIDNENKYSWLANISKVFFSCLRKVVQSIEDYIVPSPVEVSIEAPTSFAILTESEAFATLNMILISNAPVFVKAQQIENFVSKFVSKSSPVIKALRILKRIDPLLFYSNGEVQTFKSNSTIKLETWTNHIYAYPVLMQMYEEDKQLFEKSDKAIITELTSKIDELRPEVMTDLKSNILANAS